MPKQFIASLGLICGYCPRLELFGMNAKQNKDEPCPSQNECMCPSLPYCGFSSFFFKQLHKETHFNDGPLITLEAELQFPLLPAQYLFQWFFAGVSLRSGAFWDREPFIYWAMKASYIYRPIITNSSHCWYSLCHGADWSLEASLGT